MPSTNTSDHPDGQGAQRRQPARRGSDPRSHRAGPSLVVPSHLRWLCACVSALVLAATYPACSDDPQLSPQETFADALLFERGIMVSAPWPGQSDEPSDSIASISELGAPQTLVLGQYINLQLLTEFHDPFQISELLIQVEGSAAHWVIPVEADSIAFTDLSRITSIGRLQDEASLGGREFVMHVALRMRNGRLGPRATWKASVSRKPAVNCPRDISCAERSCGVDPICGQACGAPCFAAFYCSYDGQCIEPDDWDAMESDGSGSDTGTTSQGSTAGTGMDDGSTSGTTGSTSAGSSTSSDTSSESDPDTSGDSETTTTGPDDSSDAGTTGENSDSSSDDDPSESTDSTDESTNDSGESTGDDCREMPFDCCAGAGDVTSGVMGEITRDTTWTESSTCLIEGNITVAQGVTLTIEEGVTIKSGRASNNDAHPLTVHGTLALRGSASNPVLLTASTDDSAGGDTNADGDATTPGPRSWAGIVLESGGRAELEHAEIRHASTGVFTNGGELELTDIRFVANRRAMSVDVHDRPVLDRVSAEGGQLDGMLRRAGTVSEDMQWDQKDLPQVLLAEVEVAADASLSIGPGVVLKSGSIDGTTVFPLRVRGELRASGMADDPIVFTTLSDDAHGGDTQSDGDATGPTRAAWTGLVFEAGSRGQLEEFAIHFADTAIHATDTTLSVTKALLADSQYAMSLALGDSLESLADIQASSNTINGLVRRRGVLTEDAQWSETGLPQVFNGTVTVAPGASLSITEGVLLKSGRPGYNDQYPLIVQGSLTIMGSADAPVTLTAQSDDSRGGDTNGDGTDSSPHIRSWGGIQFQPGSTGHLAHAAIHYAAWGLEIDESSPSGSNLQLMNNRVGLRARGDAMPSLEQCEISGNSTGVEAVGRARVDARNNYWGGADGPSGTGDGSGDSVVGNNVEFVPFLTAPPTAR